MITAVLDTNTLASGSIASSGTLASIIDAWREGTFAVFISPEILTELARTLQKPYFRSRLTSEQYTRALALFEQRAIVTPVTVEVHGVATHPEDDVVLATAVSAGVRYLVTGDKKLQDLGVYQGITIVSPRAFLDVLTSRA